MARARILLRVDDRVSWEEHSLSGYGATPEAAVADFERMMRELAADGLEPGVPLGEPRASADVAHGGGGARGYRHGHGIVRIQRVRK